MGPIPAGIHKFVFQADAPNTEKLPSDDVVGVTVVLLTCSYLSAEFVRIGYYVNNEYADPVLSENPPSKPMFEKVCFTSDFICDFTALFFYSFKETFWQVTRE